MERQRLVLRQRKDFNNSSSNFQQKKPNYERKFINLVTQAYEESQSLEKQNKSIQCGKKLRLKLKTVPSKELEKNREPKSLFLCQKSKHQKLNSQNFVLKNANKKISSIQIETSKKKRLDCNFKPNIVYFSLKSLKESLNIKNQDKDNQFEGKIQEIKSKSKQRNYHLSSFLSEVAMKLGQIFPKILDEQKNVKKLAGSEICYSRFIKILCSLGMVRFQSEEKYRIQHEDQKIELQKIYLLWKILKCNFTSTKTQNSSICSIDVANVVVLLTAVFNVYFESVEELIETFIEKVQHLALKKGKQSEDKHQKNLNLEPNHIFFIRNKALLRQFEKITYQNIDILNLNEKIQGEISKEFESFRINRLNSLNITKTTKENLEIETEDSSIKIESLISPKSQQLAITKRLKILEEIQNSEQGSLTKESICQSELNLFLNYKKPQKNKQIKTEQKDKIGENDVKDVKKKNSVINKNTYIPSQKIKFAQLNAILKMQKGRQLRREKQLILEKGWTNNGQIRSRQSTKANNENNLEVIHSEKSKSLNKRSQSHRKFLENRKNSLQTLAPNVQKKIEAKSVQKRVSRNKWIRYNDQELIEYDEGQSNTFIKHGSESASNNTISVDQNESLDLQNYYYNNQDEFFIDNEEVPDEEIEVTKNSEHKITNNNIFAEQQIYEPESSSKTFTTETNEQIDIEEMMQASKKLLTQTQPNQSTRVIKSYLRIPILYVDVNMDESKKERIIIYEEDNPTNLAQEFGRKHGLDTFMVGRLQLMLKEQISGILGRIDEEEEDEYDDTKEDAFTNILPQDIQSTLQE